MHLLGKRVWLLLAIGLLAVPVAATGLAHACTGLATVTSAPAAGVAGESVMLSGKGFAPHDSSDVRTTPAQVHMDDVNGPVIASANPSAQNSGGNFNVAMTVPDMAPGDHVLIVTQAGLDGRPAYGTPARMVFTVKPTPVAEPAVAAPQDAAVLTPALAAPTLAVPTIAAPTARPKTSKARARARAVARCKTRYSAKKAKTKAGRKRMASKRSSCLKAANRKN